MLDEALPGALCDPGRRNSRDRLAGQNRARILPGGGWAQVSGEGQLRRAPRLDCRTGCEPPPGKLLGLPIPDLNLLSLIGLPEALAACFDPVVLTFKRPWLGGAIARA